MFVSHVCINQSAPWHGLHQLRQRIVKRTSGGFSALQVVRLSKQFDELAGHLPEKLPPRDAQLQTILSLQERVLAGRKDLERELEAASSQLQLVQRLYGQLADDRLQVADCVGS